MPKGVIPSGAHMPDSKLSDPRLRKAFELYHKNPQKGMKAAMMAAGYSESYAINPRNLKNSLGWQELTRLYLGEDRLAKLHSELLDAAVIQEYSFPADADGKVMTDSKIKELIESVPGCKVRHIRNMKNKDGYVYERIAFYNSPDNKNRREALDMAYKVLGKYEPSIVMVKPEYAHLSDDELDARIGALESAVHRGKDYPHKEVSRDKS